MLGVLRDVVLDAVAQEVNREVNFGVQKFLDNLEAAKYLQGLLCTQDDLDKLCEGAGVERLTEQVLGSHGEGALNAVEAKCAEIAADILAVGFENTWQDGF